MGVEEVGISADDAQGSIEDLLGDNLDMLEEGAEPEVESKEAAEEAEEEEETEGEEGEEAEGEEEEEAEEGEPESSVTDETLVDIQIGEDTYEVNFAELRAGYLRNEEYVNKVQEHEQEYNTKLVQLETRESELAEELRLAAVMVTGDLAKYDSINWAALKDADPAKYTELRLEAIEARERAQAVDARRKGIH